MWDLSKPGIKPVSSTLADVLERQGSPQNEFLSKNNILRIARICCLLEVPWLHSGAVAHLRCGNWDSGKSSSVWFESTNIYVSVMVHEGPAPLGIPRPADLTHSQSRVAHSHPHTVRLSRTEICAQAVEAQAFSTPCWLTWSQVPLLNICPTKEDPSNIYLCNCFSFPVL